MGFVLGGEDFRQIREDRRLRDVETDRINTRNRARLDEQRGSTAPVVPTGQQRGLTINQVGPTAAEQKAAAQQEALQRQQLLELGAFGPVDDSGDRPGTDRGPTPSYAGLAPSRVGKMGAQDVTQIQPGSVRPMQIVQGIGAGLDVQKAIMKARTAVATGKFEGIPATSPAAQFWSWLTDAANSPIHAQRDAAIKMGDWVKSEAFANVLRNDPNRITEFNAGPIAFYKKYSQQTAALAAPPPPPAAPAAPGPAAPTAPARAPVAPTANRAKGHAAIQWLESRNGENPPEWEKGATSSGNYGAIDGTASGGHKFSGVYKAQLKGLTPGSPEFNAEKDKAAASLLDKFMDIYPNRPLHAALGYTLGQGAAAKWDGSKRHLYKLADKAGREGDEVEAYINVFADEMGASIVSNVPAAPGTVKTRIITNAKGNPILADSPVIPKGEGSSMTKQLAIKKDPSKIKDLPFSMPFNFRAAEINALLAAREGLKRQAFITGGSPASSAYIEARNALEMNKVAIEHTSKMQALFLMQNNNDPRMWNELAAKMWPGRNVRISPNSDGTFRVEADGKIIGARVNKVKLITGLRKNYSQAFHKRLEDAKVTAIIKRDENVVEMQKIALEKYFDRMTEREKSAAAAVKTMFKDDQENTWGFKVGPDGRAQRVLLGTKEGKTLDGEGFTPIIPTERAVTPTNSAGLFTNVGTSGVTPALASHFKAAGFR